MYIKITLIISFIILNIGISFGQDELTTKSKKAAKRFHEALEFYNNRNDKAAIEKLKQAFAIDKNFVEAYLLSADIYFNSQDFTNEILMLENAIRISPNYNKKNYFNLGQSYLFIGDYENSLKNMEYYLSLSPDKSVEVSELYIRNCEFAIKAIENPVEFTPFNLGTELNTKYDDIMPSITADEEVMVTTVVLPVDPNYEINMLNSQEDFFISHKKNGMWTRAENMGYPVNSPNNEGAQSISSDGKIMVFAFSKKDDTKESCDIYFSRKIGNKWSQPRNIGPPINTTAWESQPSLSSDGRSLYFASNRPGGFGGKDIWVSHVDSEGYWGTPINLGPKINTKYMDASPFIHSDNSTLYFSSNGLTGMGGFDLYFSRVDYSGDFSEPTNLGYPINTHEDEEFMIVNTRGDKAYFSSNREGSRMKDIYFFELYEEARPIASSYVKGHVFNTDNQVPLNAKFELIDLESSKVIMSSYSGKDGEYLVCLPTNKNYAFNVSKPGYLFHSENFSLKGIHSAVRPFEIDINLKPIEQGRSVVLENIFFETDKYVLMPESLIELAKLIEFLENNDGIEIEIGGHTDNTGTKEHNFMLSTERAKSVYNYLISEGIHKDRLTYQGYGMRKPIADNKSEEGKSKNRRTEFKIIK